MPPSPAPDDSVPEPLLAAFGEQMMRLTRRRIVEHPDAVMETSAFRIVSTLVRSGPATLKDLADELRLDQSTINRQVNAALRRGLVERFEVEGSSSRHLRPTQAGRDAYEHDGRLRGAVIRQALHELGPERARSLALELQAFNDALDRADARAAEAAQNAAAAGAAESAGAAGAAGAARD